MVSAQDEERREQATVRLVKGYPHRTLLKVGPSRPRGLGHRPEIELGLSSSFFRGTVPKVRFLGFWELCWRKSKDELKEPVGFAEGGRNLVRFGRIFEIALVA